MLTIRLNRTGKRNRPYFRVVLQEHTKAPGKRHVEVLGSYDSMKKVAVLKKERILYWLGQGVKASDTVHNLLVREGVIEEAKRAVKIPKPVVKEEAAVPTPEKAPEAPAEEKSEESGAPAEGKTSETPKEEAGAPAEAVPAEAPVEVKPEEAPKA